MPTFFPPDQRWMVVIENGVLYSHRRITHDSTIDWSPSLFGAAWRLDAFTFPARGVGHPVASVPLRERATYFHNWHDWQRGTLAFAAPSSPTPYTICSFVLNIPLWLLGASTGVAASGVLRFDRVILRHRRSASGRCTRCAYDLKGLDRLAPCPECGHVGR
ncbi:MAG: hypothetical protein AB7Q00_10375 [Phycisphaerales bacterium]|nr:MAG: hypothetical protein IPK69_13755 [Phycisphaerales bacterium]